MAVSAEYREFVLEQLGLAVPITARSMFDGVGIYPGPLSDRCQASLSKRIQQGGATQWQPSPSNTGEP